MFKLSYNCPETGNLIVKSCSDSESLESAMYTMYTVFEQSGWHWEWVTYSID